MDSIWSPQPQSRPSKYTKPKDLTLIRNKLTDDKIDCALEKGDSNKSLSSLRRKNLNRVTLAQLNINSIRN